MTIQEAIVLVDNLKTNQYPTVLKVSWLNTLDGQIWNEVFTTHEDNDKEFNGYSKNTNQSQELLVEDPYAHDIYVYYLQAQIDKENGEISKFTQSMAMYNAAYLTFVNWYNRTHMPISHGRFMF